jgi:hypothetical protein
VRVRGAVTSRAVGGIVLAIVSCLAIVTGCANGPPASMLTHTTKCSTEPGEPFSASQVRAALEAQGYDVHAAFDSCTPDTAVFLENPGQAGLGYVLCSVSVRPAFGRFSELAGTGKSTVIWAVDNVDCTLYADGDADAQKARLRGVFRRLERPRADAQPRAGESVSPMTRVQAERAFRAEGILAVPSLISSRELVMSYTLFARSSRRSLDGVLAVFRSVDRAKVVSKIECADTPCLIVRNVVLTATRAVSTAELEWFRRALARLGSVRTP